MRNLLLALLVLLPALVEGAVLNNGILAASDTTGTNATVRSVTVTGSTNLWAGTLNATNDITLDGVSITNRLNIWTNDNGYITPVANLSAGYFFQLLGSGSGILMQDPDAQENGFAALYRGALDIGGDDDTQGVTIYGSDYGSALAWLLPNEDDGTTPYIFDTSIAHTSGSLMEVKNNGTNVVLINYDYEVVIGPAEELYLTGREDFTEVYTYQNGNSFDLWADDDESVYLRLYDSDGYLTVLDPIAGDGTTPYIFDSSLTHTFGNLIQIANNATNKFIIDYLGKTTASEGFSSLATDAAATVASTGWTNTFNKNAVVYLNSGAGITFTVYNGAGTAVFTNSTAAAVMSSVLLQPSGKVLITSGTLGVGRATPF